MLLLTSNRVWFPSRLFLRVERRLANRWRLDRVMILRVRLFLSLRRNRRSEQNQSSWRARQVPAAGIRSGVAPLLLRLPIAV